MLYPPSLPPPPHPVARQTFTWCGAQCVCDYCAASSESISSPLSLTASPLTKAKALFGKDKDEKKETKTALRHSSAQRAQLQGGSRWKIGVIFVKWTRSVSRALLSTISKSRPPGLSRSPTVITKMEAFRSALSSHIHLCSAAVPSLFWIRAHLDHLESVRAPPPFWPPNTATRRVKWPDAWAACTLRGWLFLKGCMRKKYI